MEIDFLREKCFYFGIISLPLSEPARRGAKAPGQGGNTAAHLSASGAAGDPKEVLILLLTN